MGAAIIGSEDLCFPLQAGLRNTSYGMLLRRVILKASKGFAVLNPWGEMKCPDDAVVREQECVRGIARVECSYITGQRRPREIRGLQSNAERCIVMLLGTVGYMPFPWVEPPPHCRASNSCWLLSGGLVSLSHLTPPGSRAASEE